MMAEKKNARKPVVGFFSFTCCQGCEFTILFLDNLTEILGKLDVRHFHLIKEKNTADNFDIAFVEGAITTKSEADELKRIRAKSKFVVALGACACHGGIPAMRNFVENKELNKYVYNQQMLNDSTEADPIDRIIKVDYYMYGCPIIKKEFVDFIEGYLSRNPVSEFEGPVCNQCPRRGANCYLREKKVCLGAVTHGGCDAICIRQQIPCIMCRGPLENANFPAEVNLFRSWGLDEKDIMGKLAKFGEQKLEKMKKDAEKNKP
jgi:coenzyme F420-reducing hydrogenase gamma subunit